MRDIIHRQGERGTDESAHCVAASPCSDMVRGSEGGRPRFIDVVIEGVKVVL